MNEAKLLARVQHRNVVNLLGYCAHGAEKLLVYEYVANESLDKLLFSKSSSPLILLNMDFEHSLCLIGAEIESLKLNLKPLEMQLVTTVLIFCHHS